MCAQLLMAKAKGGASRSTMMGFPAKESIPSCGRLWPAYEITPIAITVAPHPNETEWKDDLVMLHRDPRITVAAGYDALDYLSGKYLTCMHGC